jgi:hypothetical protein
MSEHVGLSNTAVAVMNNGLLGVVGGSLVGSSLLMAVFAFVCPSGAMGPGWPRMT